MENGPSIWREVIILEFGIARGGGVKSVGFEVSAEGVGDFCECGNLEELSDVIEGSLLAGCAVLADDVHEVCVVLA